MDRPPQPPPELTPVRRKRGRPRDPGADRRILEAAAELLLEHGFDKMTVDDVASQARVGKATVYRRWAKKEDLAVAAMRQLYESQMPVPDTGNLREDLRAVMAASLSFANSPAGAAYLHTSVAESMRDPRIAALYRAADQATKDSAREMFDRAILRGEVRADIDVDLAVDILSGILLVRTVSGQPMPPVQAADAMLDLVLNGVAKR